MPAIQGSAPEGGGGGAGVTEEDLAAAVAFSGCSLTKSAVQLIPGSTFTPVSFNGEEYDTDGYHDNATNNSRITAPSEGQHRFTGSIAWATTIEITGVICTLYKNGAEVISARSRLGPVPAGSDIVLRTSQDLLLAEGDYVQLVARNAAANGDAPINVTADCILQCERLGA